MEEKYVYLDWNAFKYLKKPYQARGKEFADVLKKLRYGIPFSDAHIQDLASSIDLYNKEIHDYINDDIELIIYITKKNHISYEDINYIVKKNIEPFHILKEFYDKKERQKNNHPIVVSVPDIEPFKVDLSHIPEDHPFYDILKKNNGVMDSSVIGDFSNANLFKMFEDQGTYKKFRYFTQLLASPELLKALEKNDPEVYKERKPFIELMLERNINTLESKYLNAIKSFMASSGKNFDTFPFSHKFMISYLLSDNFGLLQESLRPSGKNKLDNIRVDYLHAFYAANAEYYITMDKSTRNKTKFIYKIFGIRTEVMSIDEFLNSIINQNSAKI